MRLHPRRCGRSSIRIGLTSLVVWTIATPLVHAQPDRAEQVQADLDATAQLLQTGHPRDALSRLHAVEQIEPENPWLWFYRGLAYLKLGDWYPSMESLDHAQDLLTAYGNPDPLLAESIRRYRREARSRVFGISLNLGLAYDSNVTFLGSGGAGLDIAGRGDGKFASRLQFAYAPIADESERLTFGARIANAWHFSIEEFDDQDYGATVRYVRKLDESWSIALQYDYDITYLGNQPFSSVHAVAPSLIYTWRRPPSAWQPTETTLLYRIEGRDFLFDTDPVFDRDGYANAVAVEQKFIVRPDTNRNIEWDLGAGYSFQSVATEGREFDRLDHTFYLSLEMPLTNPWMPDKELTLGLNANWQIADYRKDSVIDADGDERSDFLTTINAVISQKLVKDPDGGDVTLHGIVGWTDANSNVTTTAGDSPFTYDKWVAGVQLEWTW